MFGSPEALLPGDLGGNGDDGPHPYKISRADKKES